MTSLRKHDYSNILKILPPKKNENFQKKNSDIFHMSAQNIDCWYSLEPPRRGGSNEYSQSMFLSRNKKNYVYPCKPQLYYIKVGFKGSNYIGMFSWCNTMFQWCSNQIWITFLSKLRTHLHSNTHVTYFIQSSSGVLFKFFLQTPKRVFG